LLGADAAEGRQYAIRSCSGKVAVVLFPLLNFRKAQTKAGLRLFRSFTRESREGLTTFGCEAGVGDYSTIRYVRSPSVLVDSTFNPIFFVSCPLTNPRIEWFCQSVAFAISASVAPCSRRRSARTISFFCRG
jgi:hypothetical protein